MGVLRARERTQRLDQEERDFTRDSPSTALGSSGDHRESVHGKQRTREYFVSRKVDGFLISVISLVICMVNVRVYENGSPETYSTAAVATTCTIILVHMVFSLRSRWHLAPWIALAGSAVILFRILAAHYIYHRMR